ncbi:hypothetical protein ATANTOWER_024936 [Ataeniobius toweri]|uniref:Secreted protein n=1 Tax=Ataeniobius toweri TaxID=208326 RepID=A0ABU7BRE0_9TELE|nr:hypothetical protein [Ataeniobius toweri]
MTLRSNCFSTYFKSLLSSAFLLALFGFLRLSEFTSPSNSFVPSRDSAFSDLKFYPVHFKLYFKHIKGKGPCFISIARLNGLFSPFQAMFSFVLKRHKSAHPSCPFSLLQKEFP